MIEMFVKIILFILFVLFSITSCNILKKKIDPKDNNVIIITNFKGDSLSSLIGQLKSNSSLKPITDSIEKTINSKNSLTNKNFFPNNLIHKSYLNKNSNKKIKLNENINKSFFKTTLNQLNDNQNSNNFNFKTFDDKSEIEDKNSFYHNYQNYNSQSYNPLSYNQQSYIHQNSNQQSSNQLNYNHQNYNHPNYNSQTYNQPIYNQENYNQQINNQQSYNHQNQLNSIQQNNNKQNYKQEYFNQNNLNQNNQHKNNHQNFNQLNYPSFLMNEQNYSNYDKLFNTNKLIQNENLRRNQEDYFKVDFKNYLNTQIPSFYYPIKENKNFYDLFYQNVNKFDYLKEFTPYKPNYLNRNLFNLNPIPYQKINNKIQFEDDDLKDYNKTDDNQILKNFELINNKILTHLILNNYLKNLSMNITDPFIKRNKLLSTFENDHQDRLAESNIIRKKVRRRMQPNQIIIKKYIQLPNKKIKRIQKKNSQKSIRPLIIKKIETPSIIIESPIKQFKQNFHKKINYFDDENYLNDEDDDLEKNFYSRRRKNFIDNDGYQFEESEQKNIKNNYFDSNKLEKDYLAPDEKEEEFFESYKKNFLNQEQFSESSSKNNMIFLIKPKNISNT